MLTNYFRAAAAVFCCRKFLTFVSLFGITVTLSILLLVTTVLDHTFGEALPEVEQDRTLGVFRACLLDDEENGIYALPGYGLLDRYLRDLPGAERVSISSVFWKGVSYVGNRRIESYLKYTDAAFWEVFEFDFMEGRAYSVEEVSDSLFVAVINEATRRRFFGDQPAVGRAIEVDGIEYRITGVVRNVSMLRAVPFADIWIPQTTADDYDDPQELAGLHLGLIRARSPDDLDRIRSAFAARMASIDLSGNHPYTRVVAVAETKFETVARLVFSFGRSAVNRSAELAALLLGAAALFMLLPAINLVNLTLSRVMERATEVGVRKTFGASSRSIVGQFLFESFLLTLVGAGLSIPLSFLILHFVSKSELIPYATFTLTGRIFLLTAVAASVFGLGSGAYPAWRMARIRPVEALRGSAS